MKANDIEQLRAAWRSDPHPYADGEYCPDPGQIYDAVCGGLSARRRRRMVRHLGLCGACGQVWRAAEALRRERPVPAASRRSAGLPPLPVLATAALAALAVAVGVWQLAPRLGVPGAGPGDTTTLRGSADSSLDLLVPDGQQLPRDAFWLSWETVPEAVNYRLRVTGQNLELIYAAATESGNLKLPAGRLEALREGDPLFWYVVAELEDGRQLRSETRVARVE